MDHLWVLVHYGYSDPQVRTHQVTWLIWIQVKGFFIWKPVGQVRVYLWVELCRPLVCVVYMTVFECRSICEAGGGLRKSAWEIFGSEGEAETSEPSMWPCNPVVPNKSDRSFWRLRFSNIPLLEKVFEEGSTAVLSVVMACWTWMQSKGLSIPCIPSSNKLVGINLNCLSAPKDIC